MVGAVLATAIVGSVAVAVAASPSTTRSGTVTVTEGAHVLSPSASGSDAFDAWTESEHDPGAVFLASDDADAGRSALLVRRTGGVTTTPSTLTQQIAVVPGSLVVLTFRSSAQDGAAGAVQVGLGLPSPETLAVPQGPYGWRSFQVQVAVPAGVTSTAVTISAVGDTSGVLIDSMQVRDGDRSVGPVNGGFEEQSADLRLTDASLLLEEGAARLHLASRRAAVGTVRWTVSAEGGGAIRTGTALIADHRGLVPLTGLPAGAYELRVDGDLAGRAVDRSVAFGVLAGPVPSGSRRFGLGVPIGGETGDALAMKVRAAEDLGVGAVRTSVNWGNFERSPGEYTSDGDVRNAVSAFEAAGLEPLLVAHYGNSFYDDGTTPSSPSAIAAYARFAAAVAVAYPGTALDVENEPNAATDTSRCGLTPACYLQLLRPAAGAVRAASPDTVLSAPALAGGGIDLAWMQGFIDGGGLGLTDVVSVHPYYRPDQPDALGPQLEALQAMLQAAAPGDAPPIWITEFGDPTGSAGLSTERQAQDIVRATTIGLAKGASRVYWYDEVDHTPIASDPESNYGLYRAASSFAPHAFQPKPAAIAAAVLVRRIGDATATGCTESPTGVRTITFGSGPAAVRVVWAVGAAERIGLVGSASVTDMLGTDLPVSGGVLTVGADPVYVQGDVHLITP